MSAVNPYQPPRAHVEDIAEEGGAQPLRLWSARGRIGRLRFLAWSTGAYLLLALAAGIGSVVPVVGPLLTLAAVVGYVVFFVLVSIQRAHDMDWSGWSIFLMLIPIAGLI